MAKGHCCHVYYRLSCGVGRLCECTLDSISSSNGHLLAPNTADEQKQMGPDGISTTTTMTHPYPLPTVTLRDFLTDIAAFIWLWRELWLYGFGALAAWEEGIDASILSPE
jgi:hypothetical protein